MRSQCLQPLADCSYGRIGNSPRQRITIRNVEDPNLYASLDGCLSDLGKFAQRDSEIKEPRRAAQIDRSRSCSVLQVQHASVPMEAGPSLPLRAGLRHIFNNHELVDGSLLVMVLRRSEKLVGARRVIS
jgi:hypothetical protein